MSLRVITLERPDDCLECRFYSMREVQLSSGEKRRMIHCSRLDCDNWQTADEDAPAVAGFVEEVRDGKA